MKTAEKEVVITHVFDAPVETVFEAWTNRAWLEQWFAPDGCRIEFNVFESQSGGKFHYCIHDPRHGDCWITGRYVEIVPNQRIQLTMQLSDQAGKPQTAINAGKQEDWPAETITTIQFEPMDGKTRITLHQAVSERLAKQTGAYQSWVQMFEILNTLLLSGRGKG